MLGLLVEGRLVWRGGDVRWVLWLGYCGGCLDLQDSSSSECDAVEMWLGFVAIRMLALYF